MIERIQRAKHWQLFILLLVVPIVAQVFLMNIFFHGPNVNGMFTILLLIALIPLCVFFGWFWSVGVGLHSKVPKEEKMDVKRFKMFWAIPLSYFGLIFIGMITGGSLTFMNEGGGFLILFIVLMHLLSMFSIFYCLYFCAKTLKSIELQRKVVFGDYAGEFFLIWFFMIGIWVLQPKINNLVEGQERLNDEILD